MRFLDFLTGVSGLSWTIVYLVIIYRGFKDKSCGMPLIALGLNFSWEFIYTFVFPSADPVQLIANGTWFFFDIVIIVLKFMYGKDEFAADLPGLNKKWFYPTAVFALVFSFFFVYIGAVEWKDYIGMYSAYLMNILMSLMFIPMLLRQEGVRAQSLYVAFFKLLGTLAPTLVYFIYYMNQHPFIPYAGAICFVFDVIYLVMLYNRYKSLNLNPFTRKAVGSSGNLTQRA